MSRKFRLTGLELGGDLQNLDIYHTSITASNLLVSDITASLLASTGIVVEVDDNVTTFIARAKDGDCNNRSGSLNIGIFQPSTRYFEVISDGEGYVSAILPDAIGPVTSSFTATVNYLVDPLFVIEADNSFYPGFQFQGWYNAVSGSGTLLSTESQLSIGLNDYTASLSGDSIYAYFG